MSIKGYDPQEACKAIAAKIIAAGTQKNIAYDLLERAIREAIRVDEIYMKQVGILTGSGEEGNTDAIYDDDDAFEFISDQLIESGNFAEIPEMRLAQLADEYMEYNQEYLEDMGLLSWDDEK